MMSMRVDAYKQKRARLQKNAVYAEPGDEANLLHAHALKIPRILGICNLSVYLRNMLMF